MKKLFEFMGYIKLPDDFEGDEIDALKYYIKYREETNRKNTIVDVEEEAPQIDIDSIKEQFGFLYDKLNNSDQVRAGSFRILELENNEWEETHSN